jgi:hypothetical protein
MPKSQEILMGKDDGNHTPQSLSHSKKVLGRDSYLVKVHEDRKMLIKIQVISLPQCQTDHSQKPFFIKGTKLIHDNRLSMPNQLLYN